jgi:hypothetical protein
VGSYRTDTRAARDCARENEGQEILIVYLVMMF